MKFPPWLRMSLVGATIATCISAFAMGGSSGMGGGASSKGSTNGGEMGTSSGGMGSASSTSNSGMRTLAVGSVNMPTDTTMQKDAMPAVATDALPVKPAMPAMPELSSDDTHKMMPKMSTSEDK